MRNEKFKDLVFYEIYPTSFYDSNNDGIGDLKGISQKLEYVKELGCNAIWFNPFFVSPFKDGGYDIKDFFDIDPRFGDMKDFEEMVKKAHSLGIKVILDCVAGHASEENKEFLMSGLENRNEYTDLFIWTESVWNNDPKYKLIAGRHPRNGNYLVNFFSVQPAFNYGFNHIDDPKWQMSYKDPRTFQARDYLIKIIMFWLEKGADGFRVDMADSLVKNDDEKEATIEVWNYVFDKVKKVYPDAFFVSEWCNPYQSFKAGFDADFVLDHWDTFYHRFIRSGDYSTGTSILKGGEYDYFLEDLKRRTDIAKELGGYLANISGNHDVTRLANYSDYSGLRLYYMLMFALPGIPFIYYGDEIGMKFVDLPNKDGGYQRVGSRTPMQWDHSKNDGFSKAKELYLPVNTASDITVEDNLKDPSSLYHFIQKLIKVRKENIDLQSDEIDIGEDQRVLCIKRGSTILLINLSDQDVEYSAKEVLVSTTDKPYLPPRNGVIYRN